MVTRSQRGYTLLEVVISLAIFGMIIAIFAIITAEMRSREKRAPVNFMRHPQVAAVLARMRRDVQDAYGPEPFLDEFRGFTMGEKTLIFRSMQANGGLRTIVWDFSAGDVVKRHEYNVGIGTVWPARGLPADFNVTLDAVDIEGRPWGVRVMARDAEGRLAIDQILQPRAH